MQKQGNWPAAATLLVCSAACAVTLAGSALQPQSLHRVQAPRLLPAILHRDEQPPAPGFPEAPAESTIRQRRPDSMPASSLGVWRLSSDGLLAAKVWTIDSTSKRITLSQDATVRLMQNGEIKVEAQTGEGGVAQLKGLAPGTYSLSAVGPNAFAAFGIEVLPSESADGESTNGSAGRSEAFLIPVLMIPPQDQFLATQLLRTRLPQLSLPPVAHPSGLALSDSRETNSKEQPPNTEALSGRSFAVALQENGQLVGRIQSLDALEPSGGPRNLRLYFAARGQIAADVAVASNGDFVVLGLPPGLFGVIAVGRDGFAIQGIEVLDSAAPTAEKGQLQVLPVSLNSRLAASPASSFSTSLVLRADQQGIVDQLLAALAQGYGQVTGAGTGTGTPGGAPGGGGGAGGGGGVGGGGGLGGLLPAALIGGAAAGAAALLNNNHNSSNPTSP